MNPSDDFLWVEKYRPQTIVDCILPERLKSFFAQVAKGVCQDAPNMLLSGGAGCGKTTVAKALCNEMGVDYLYTENEVYQLLPKTGECYEKHGSGCVLSAAITANLALEQNLKTACEQAKIYTENYLQSNPTKLGFHHV